MSIVDTLLGMSREEVRVLLAIVVSCCGLCGYLFFLLGKARGWTDRRREIGRNNVVVESAIFRDLPDGSIEFAIETADRMPPLSELLCDGHLEARARKLVSSCVPGDPLFGHGHDHYVAMERVGLLITGSDPVATQSALLGRHDDYHLDRVAFVLTCARGEDGLQMARIIKANPRDLDRLRDPDVIRRIVPLRQVHSYYVPILETMAAHYAASLEAFARDADERKAGRAAAVWTTFIRTQRTMAMTEAELRRIVRDELAGVGAGAPRMAVKVA